jgi:hypothetical protein
MTITRGSITFVGILSFAVVTGARSVSRGGQQIAPRVSADSASLVARALAIANADGKFGALRLTAFRREGDLTTITFQHSDPEALGGGVVVHINDRSGRVCLEVFG